MKEYRLVKLSTPFLGSLFFEKMNKTRFAINRNDILLPNRVKFLEVGKSGTAFA